MLLKGSIGNLSTMDGIKVCLMSYINQFKLIQEIVRGRKPNAKQLLEEVNRKAVIRAIKKSKDGLPKPFKCTHEPIEEENLAQMPYRNKKKLWDIYDRLKEHPGEAEKELPTLIKLRKKYPNVPSICNYIGLVYAYSKQMEKYFDILTETTRKFPNYLFGKTALAEYYLNRGKHNEVPKIFDRKFEIYMHFPSMVTVFHVSEVRAFYSTVGIYYARSNRTARALFCYFIINEADPEHWATEKLGDEIISIEMAKFRKKITKTRGY